MPSSIKDVASHAGVSIATVSRVLSGKGYISDEAKQTVQAAVKALGYRPNRVARSLRAQSSRVIGLVISDIRNPFFSEISRAVENTALAHGYSVMICNADEDPSKEARYLQLMAEEKVAGILLSPTRSGMKKLAEFTRNGPPIVLFDRKMSGAGIDSVVIDNFDASYRLTRALLDGGFQQIVGIFGAKSYTAEERIKGFHAAFEGRDQTPLSILRAPAFEEEGEKLAAQIRKLDPPADAILCSSALLASGCYKALRQMGLRIPEDLGFACFDDPSWAAFVESPVTVIRQPAPMIGQTAAELLMKRIDDPTRSVSDICLTGELVERETSRRVSTPS